MDFAYDKKFRFDFIKHAGKSEEWALVMFPADDLKHLYINDEKFYCDFTDYWDSGLSSDKKYYRVHLKNYTFWVEPDEYDELMEFLDERRDRCLRARAQQENEWGVQPKQRNENDYTISATIQPPQYQQTQQQQYPANQPLPRVQITGAIWWLRPLGIILYFIGICMLSANSGILGAVILGAGWRFSITPRNHEEKRLYGRTTSILRRPIALFGIAFGLMFVIGTSMDTPAAEQSITPTAPSAQVTTTEQQDTETETISVLPIDIMQIANQNEQAVAEVLGEPTYTEPGHLILANGEFSDTVKHTYAGEHEVMFCNGIATRITLYPNGDYQCNDTPRLIGMANEDIGTPETSERGDYRWKNCKTVYSVSAFSGDYGKLSYIYIITDEKYS